MPAPVHVDSDANLDTLLRANEHVFVMYYKDKSEVYTRAILPIWEDLSSEHRSASPTFVIAQKGEVPTSCMEQSIPVDTRMTFAVFHNASRVEILDSGKGLTSTEVENIVQKHTPLCSEQQNPSSSHSEPQREPQRCESPPTPQHTATYPESHLHRCYDRRCLNAQRYCRTVFRSVYRVKSPVVTSAVARSQSPRPPNSEGQSRCKVHRYTVRGSAHTTYRGYNGRYYYANIETRGGCGSEAKPTFMDISGPIDIQRELE